jgi:hypothetical protein
MPYYNPGFVKHAHNLSQSMSFSWIKTLPSCCQTLKLCVPVGKKRLKTGKKVRRCRFCQGIVLARRKGTSIDSF